MKVFTHNFNPDSNSGPNKFTRQLFKQLKTDNDIQIVGNQQIADIEYCLIQQSLHKVKPMVLRLDGIWFNSHQDFNQQNEPIKFAYKNADAVIFQSEFNRRLTEKWFGSHSNSHVIHNAPDLEQINSKVIMENYNDLGWPWPDGSEVWSCASSWRPHKRLKENIKYFLEFAPQEAYLGIAGTGVTREDVSFTNDSRIHFFGELNYQQLLCLYRRSKVFLHLAYLDHCPNVVVDAQASGCKIICSSTGGTKEIVNDGVIIMEEEWDFTPVELYKPPPIDFSKSCEVKRSFLKNNPNITSCAEKYFDVMKGITNAN